MNPDDVATTLTLDDLRYRYGWALDRCDPDALRDVFHPDATFRLFSPGADTPDLELQGREQLVPMTTVMPQRYARTMHVMSNPICTIDGDTATGDVYCVAHHLILDDGPPRKFVTHLRYADEFRRGPDDVWRIARRDVHFLWADEIPALDWETALVRGRLA